MNGANSDGDQSTQPPTAPQVTAKKEKATRAGASARVSLKAYELLSGAQLPRKRNTPVRTVPPARLRAKVVTIPSLEPDCFGAMAFLAALAYPNRRELPQRKAFVEACKAMLLNDYRDLGWCDESQITPRFRYYTQDWRGDIYEGGKILMAWDRILRRRLPAAKMAQRMLLANFSRRVPWLRFELDGTLVETKANAIRGGLNEAARAIDPNNIKNVKVRVWRDSAPVLHLCLVLWQLAPKMRGRFSAHELLRDPTWAKSAIAASERALRILSLPPVSMSAADAIRLKYASE
jgi:hypothetical protein